MEATIQSNQMDVDKEKAGPNPEVASLPQGRHVWRIPELPPIPQGLDHFQVAEIEIYQSQYRNCFREAKEEEWEICPSLWQGAMNSYLHIKSFLYQKKEFEITPALEKEGPVKSTSSKPVPEVCKDKPKGPQKKQRGPKSHQGKGKGKAKRKRPYQQGYRIPKVEPSAMDSVFNMAQTLMELTAKKQERMNRTFQCK
ncbi:hypothetical protein O181_121960 [Austropuccinia psidii MF-1]|uniref:Uncharacterized protein n=1 Tax=Austropuccinia psidii MF-1 TaxID=1389203 RepID=A0A9Q3Q2T2_9BASI|nr:hypothetical protein [Austropuccinia psidii MF-1]